jgi:hypothetical protein
MQNPGIKRLTVGLTVSLAAALLAVPAAHARIAVDARDAALPNTADTPRVTSESKIVEMHRHLTQLQLPATETRTIESGSSFDWGDAGIGAGVGLGLVLIAGGGVLVTRRKLVNA